MNMDLDFIAQAMTSAVAVVPIIVALVQVAKMMKVPNQFAPIVSIGVGVLISFLFGTGDNVGQTILSGILYGLSASGLYSGIKTTAHAKKEETTVNGSNLLNSERQDDGTKVMFVETNKEDNH
jgi:ABC-type dipeptide/oligopeptide/nickel transport system permease subunit